MESAVEMIKANAPKAVKVVGQLVEIQETESGSTLLVVETALGDTKEYWVNQKFWDKLSSRFKEGDFVCVSAEKRIADKTTYTTEDDELKLHTKTGEYFQSMVKSSEARFMQEQQSMHKEGDIALIEASANASAVAAYLGAIRK